MRNSRKSARGRSVRDAAGRRDFLGDGHLKSIELRAVRSVFDDTGRFAPRYDDHDVVTLDADSCVLAIGQSADLGFLTPTDGIELSPSGTIRVNSDTLATSLPGVFAGGDVAFGLRILLRP